MGAHGSGKSVLTRVLDGLVEPSEGRVLIAGKAVGDMPEGKFASLSHGFGVLFGDSGTYKDMLDLSLSVVDNLAVVLLEGGADEASATVKAREWAREWDLGEVADEPAGRIEYLALHRLCLAQALVGDPPLVIVDDPYRAVDINHLDSEIESIKRWQERSSGTIMLTTHSLALAKALADQVAILRDGKVLKSGPAEEVLAGIKDDVTFTRAFGVRLGIREADPERLAALAPPEGKHGHFYLDLQTHRRRRRT
jgi:D-methionine transport system ATP-binding protein